MAIKNLEKAIMVPTGSHRADKLRARKAVCLWHKIINNHVLISGSTDGKKFPFSQPGHIYMHMRVRRVPKKAFDYELWSKCTEENVAYSGIVSQLNDTKELSVVSNRLHLLRFRYFFRRAKILGLADKDLKINYFRTPETAKEFFKTILYETGSWAEFIFSQKGKFRNCYRKSVKENYRKQSSGVKSLFRIFT